VSAQDLLRQGIAASKAGRKAEARSLLEQAIAEDEYNATAWLWLSGAVDTDEDRRICLENVLTLDPENTFAKKGLAMLGPAPEPPPPQVTTDPAPSVDEPAIYEEPAAEQGSSSYVVYEDTPSTQRDSEPVVYEDRSAPQASSDHAMQAAAPAAAVRPTETPPAKEKAAEPEAKKGSTLLWVLGITALVVGIGLVGLALIGVLTQEPAAAVDTKEAVLGVIVENIAAHNAEDVERYMDTIHRFSPARFTTRAMLEQSYSQFDLSSQIYGLQIIEMDKREAKVSFILITKKIRGPAFRDNRVEGTMILRKQGKEWKLYGQEVENITYLN
jgi:hypothetical protein